MFSYLLHYAPTLLTLHRWKLNKLEVGGVLKVTQGLEVTTGETIDHVHHVVMGDSPLTVNKEVNTIILSL